MNEKHVAKQDFEEPCAVMPARTDLWESRESNPPRPPGTIQDDKPTPAATGQDIVFPMLPHGV